MRPRRRQELRTNELAQTLADLGNFFSRYGTYVLAAAVVVMVVIVSVWYTGYSRRSSRRNAWERYYSLALSEPEQQLAAFRQLAEDSTDPVLSTTAWFRLGHIAWMQAHGGEALDNPDRWDELLQTSQQAFERVTQSSPAAAEITAAARAGLAAIAQEQYDPQTAREQYQAILDAAGSASTGFDKLAETGLAAVDRITKPITFAPARSATPPTFKPIPKDQVPPQLREKATQQLAGEAAEEPVGPFLDPARPEPVQPTTIPVSPGP